MRLSQRFTPALWMCLCFPFTAWGSAYNAHPKLVVVIVIDQFRGDYLERYRDQFGDNGFRLLLDHGAYFSNCNYNYANTSTAPGHATLLTGAYSNGHGIIANEWWDAPKNRRITSVRDDDTKLTGINSGEPGASPHNLQADTLGDELKLATQGKARVFGIALKDRAAILPAGFSADGAFWIDHKSGRWISSTYYGRSELPQWAQNFNDSKRTDKYLNKEWTDADGNVLRKTTIPAAANGKSPGFYEVVGSTPFANDYEFEFARELITYEKLGSGPSTDLLIISLSANDILGHQVGPDSPEMKAMALALDHEVADFFNFLGHQIGLADTWIALSADHGVAPTQPVSTKLRIPAPTFSPEKLRAAINQSLAADFAPGKATEFLSDFDYPIAWLNQTAFSNLKIKEEDAERAAGEAMKQVGLRGYFTKSQLARGDVPNTELGIKFAHSFAPIPGWYVMGVSVPFSLEGTHGTDHISPYTYDTHVPLAFYGLPFQPGTYRTRAEPVDLAATLASLLGINAPSHAIGRVLTEALAPSRSSSSASASTTSNESGTHP